MSIMAGGPSQSGWYGHIDNADNGDERRSFAAEMPEDHRSIYMTWKFRQPGDSSTNAGGKFMRIWSDGAQDCVHDLFFGSLGLPHLSGKQGTSAAGVAPDCQLESWDRRLT